MRFIIIFSFLFAYGCGVKAPPIAPTRHEQPEANMDCSPYDAECDATDRDYIPRKK